MSLALAFVALFGAGVVGAASPCVLPLLPGVVLVLVDGRQGAARAPRMALFAGAAAATFAAFGALVSTVHVAFTASNTARLAGAWLLALAVATVAIDRGVWRPPQWQLRRSLAGWGAPLALGVGCGAVWSPCVGPLLGAAATASAGTGSAWRGATLLFAFGLGVVTPALLLSLVPVPSVPAWARRSGALVRRLIPVAMAMTGLLLLTGWYVPFVQRLGSAT
jgi:cytochrome c-type biogenesis protein